MRQCPSGTADLGPHWDHTVCAMPNDPRICAPLSCPQIAGDQRRCLTATFWGASVGSGGRRPTKRTPRRPLRAVPSSHELGGRNPVPAAKKLNADVPVEDSGNHEEPAAPCVFVDTPSLHGILWINPGADAGCGCSGARRLPTASLPSPTMPAISRNRPGPVNPGERAGLYVRNRACRRTTTHARGQAVRRSVGSRVRYRRGWGRATGW
jgi:hypothetical protein